MDQQIYTEENLSSLTRELSPYRAVNTLVVTGSSSYKNSGAKALIESILSGNKLFFFNDFTTNPKVNDLKKGIVECNNSGIGLIAAIGGGSVIDMAKLIRCYMNIQTDLAESIKANRIFPGRNIPLIAIPTTAGSGSESTRFAVIYIDNCKFSVTDKSVRPDYAVLIPSLTHGCPPYLTACSGADALCQAIESYWSVQSTEESRNFAKEAIILLWKYLPSALKNDANARKNVMYAANLAGRAINISFTTASHACSYGLTAHIGIPHGHAVSLTLPYFFNLNLKASQDNCNDPRGATFVRERMNELLLLLDCNADNAGNKLNLFFNKLFENYHEEVKSEINNEIKKQLVSSVNLQRLQNNPVKISKEDLENIDYYTIKQEK